MVSATGTSQGAALLVKDAKNLQHAAVCSTGLQEPEKNRLAEYAGHWAKICC
jgi:hypothetical protein